MAFAFNRASALLTPMSLCHCSEGWQGLIILGQIHGIHTMTKFYLICLCFHHIQKKISNLFSKYVQNWTLPVYVAKWWKFDSQNLMPLSPTQVSNQRMMMQQHWKTAPGYGELNETWRREKVKKSSWQTFLIPLTRLSILISNQLNHCEQHFSPPFERACN